MTWRLGTGSPARLLILAALGAVAMLVGVLAALGAGIAGETGLLSVAGQGCGTGGTGSAGTPSPNPGPSGAAVAAAASVSSTARNSIPASYLALYQLTGQRYGVPWPVLAGIGEVETDHGRSTLPGVHSGANSAGAAGPMQIGIGGAAGNTWGGAPVHPASEQVSGVGIDANGDGTASVYDPADAIAGAAKYLLEHGVLTNVAGAVFAYNHLMSYVQAVLGWAETYSRGGFTVTAAAGTAAVQCPVVTLASPVASQAVNTVIGFARAQLGKPYLFGGTGPDAFDCSGLMMMAYRAAGINIPRTSQAQWAWGPRVVPSQVQPGDLVFFAGADGTLTSPGHVGLVIGHNLMIEAYATGFPIRVSQFGTPAAAPGDSPVVGFTRPWAHTGVVLTAAQPAG